MSENNQQKYGVYNTVDSNGMATEKKEYYNRFKKAKETGVRSAR